jgi:hypothetical protein
VVVGRVLEWERGDRGEGTCGGAGARQEEETTRDGRTAGQSGEGGNAKRTRHDHTKRDTWIYIYKPINKADRFHDLLMFVEV